MPDLIDQNPPPDNGQQTPPAAKPPASWDEFYESLTPEVQALYDGHVQGLSNSVRATRDERDNIKNELKALGQLLGSDANGAKAKVEALLEQVDRSERRVAFLEAAVKPEIGCRNPGLAFLLAETNGLFTGRGDPDWAAIREAAPELFGAPAPKGGAGSGTGTPPPAKTSMNDWIRRQTGRE